MYETLTIVTSVILIAGWLLFSLAVRRKNLSATIVRVLPAQMPMQELLAVDLLVRLDDGREVVARAGGCARCQGDFRPGRPVALLHNRGAYVVTIPPFGVRRNCEEQV